MITLKKDNGNTLFEVLLALLVVVLLGSAITSLFSFGMNGFSVHTKYTAQQDKIVKAIRMFRTDFEQATSINYTGSQPYVNEIILTNPGISPTTRTWKFDGTSLWRGTEKVVDNIVLSEVIGGVNERMSYFYYNDTSDKRLILSIKPVPTNTGRNQGNNIKKPTTAEFSVKYKLY